MKLIFERSMPGRGQDIFPECDVEIKLPQAALREKEAALPEIPRMKWADITPNWQKHLAV